jgi:GNAT superfamily N-acetyltransferase
MNDDDMLTGAALGLLKIRSQAHTASTDGIRYAHIIEADVAEDLRRLAMPMPTPEGVTFHYHPTDDTIPTQPWPADPTRQVGLFSAPAVEARHDGRHVGHLEWDPYPYVEDDEEPIPTVSMIKVHPDYQRHGIGTALWDFARRHEPDLEHSHVRTELGEKWVNHERSRTAGPRRRFNQDWQQVGFDLMPVESVAHYMQRKETGFGDEKHQLYEMAKQPPLSQQIKDRGYEKPVHLVTDGRSGSIYDGHHRIDIARQLGHTHIPVEVSWRTPYPEAPDGMFGNRIEPWLKGWLTDMRKGRETVGMRLAALNQQLLDRLHGEFHDWWRSERRDPQPGADPTRGPIGHWPHVEQFLFEQYPAASMGFEMGMEEAGPVMDGTTIPYLQGAEYETGPDATKLYGYDPKEVAAGLLLLHNKTHPLRGDVAQKDLDRLTDIAQKRYQMQRTYEQRTAGQRGALPEGLRFQHHPEGFEPFPDVIMPTVNVSSAWPTVSAWDGDRMIGHIQWDGDHPRKKGQIWDLRVHPDYQRRGVATALFDWTTDKIEPNLQHSTNLSDEGRAFAEAEDRRPLAQDRYEAWRAGQPMPKRFAATPDWGAVHQQGRDDLHRLTTYLSDGIHADFDQAVPDIGKHPDSHHLLYTPHWAGQALAMASQGDFNKRVQARANHYWTALSSLATHGPQHPVAPRTTAHQAHQAARDQFRVELQHGYHFAVPDLSQLSRLADPSEADHLVTVNPRYDHGLLGRTDAARDAYKINCQRSVLALDARKRGYNVEARPNYRPSYHDRHADEQFGDHDIASWWRDADGHPGQWTDVGDLPDLANPEDFSGMTKRQVDQYLRGGGMEHMPLAHNPGPHHWDVMERNIAAWGPSARAAIAVTKGRPGGIMRHIIHAEVGPNGQVTYHDPQDPAGEPTPGQSWRAAAVYGHDHNNHRLERGDAASLYADPVARIEHRNRKWSPLRYLRLDDRQLAPHTAKYMVDRGTAGADPITPPPTR